MKLFILGLRRSGTTTFWEAFRRDPRFVGYNEPFNPLLRHVSESDWIQLYEPWYGEFRKLWERSPALFWSRFRAIHELEEIQPDLADHQREYLDFLLSSAEHTVFDFTRVHFKVASLAKQAPDAVLVHLHRAPGSFATSHMVPSGSQIIGRGDRRRIWKSRLSNAWVARANRATFFARADRFDYWGVETIVGTSPGSLFGQRLRESGLDPHPVYRWPALGRLLAYWQVNYRRLEEDGPRHFGERYLRVRFEDFCRQPRETLARVYAALGATAPPDIDLSGVHPARGRFRPEHPDWDRYARALQLPGLVA